jgi:Uma2 family endonuclease
LAGEALGEVYFAPLDVVLSDENVLQPELMFISRERIGIIEENNIQGAPDLVIEILSPSTADKDRVLKKNIYARFGVREYWIVDPDARSIEVYVARDAGLELVRCYPEGTSVSSTVLTDLHLDVSPVFA